MWEELEPRTLKWLLSHIASLVTITSRHLLTLAQTFFLAHAESPQCEVLLRFPPMMELDLDLLYFVYKRAHDLRDQPSLHLQKAVNKETHER